MGKYNIEGLTLRQKQSVFVLMVSDLIRFAYENGYELTFGDAWAFNLWPVRNLLLPILPKKWVTAFKARMHKKGSFHYKRLAIDLNAFKDGDYLTTTEAHHPLGEYWESLGGTWGGRWNDGNHYSLGE